MNEPRFVAEILKTPTIYGEKVVVIIDKIGAKNPRLRTFRQDSDPKRVLEAFGYEDGTNTEYLDHREA